MSRRAREPGENTIKTTTFVFALRRRVLFFIFFRNFKTFVPPRNHLKTFFSLLVTIYHHQDGRQFIWTNDFFPVIKTHVIYGRVDTIIINVVIRFNRGEILKGASAIIRTKTWALAATPCRWKLSLSCEHETSNNCFETSTFRFYATDGCGSFYNFKAQKSLNGRRGRW